ncbi:MAG: ABC transporter substrate-binding protein [Chloroflexota bacterium]
MGSLRLVAIAWGLAYVCFGCAAPSAPAAAAPTVGVALPSPTAAPAQPTIASPSAVPPSANPVTIKIAQAPGVGNAPAYLADARGYFAEQGLKAEFVRVVNSTELQQLVSTGDTNIGLGGLSAAFFNGLNRGLDIRLLAGNYQTPPDGNSQLPIVARKTAVEAGEIKTIADLKGRKVAVNGTGAGTEYSLDQALRSGGLTIADVDLTVLGYPEMVSALSSGVIDAAIILEPIASKAVSGGAGVKLLSQYGAGTQNSVLMANYQWARTNPDQARRVLVAFLKGAADTQNGQWRTPDSIAILQKYTNSESADLLASGTPSWPTDGRLNDVLKQEQFFRDRGYVAYTDPLTRDKIEDPTFLAAALTSLGH